jgi:propionyl-CoA synthetase
MTKAKIGLALPFGPSGLTTLFNDDSRFYKGYLKRFDGKWMDTGDAGMMDEDGYVHVMSRSDDIINVAAHRFSTGENTLRHLSISCFNTDTRPGAIEQAITSHKSVAEACVVGIPDAMKGHLPFAFVIPSTSTDQNLPATPSKEFFTGINNIVREQIGAIASLGGIIQGKGMIPKTRSGKTLRRVLRELVENGVKGEYDKEVNVPATVEDREVVEVARAKVREYLEELKKKQHSSKPKL